MTDQLQDELWAGGALFWTDFFNDHLTEVTKEINIPKLNVDCGGIPEIQC
jgi:hypothetical protein